MLPVYGEASIAPDPRERALDDPALWQEGEALLSWLRPDDLQPPVAGPDEGAVGFWPLMAPVGEDGLEEGEAPSRSFVQNKGRRVAILNRSRVDDDPQHQAKLVDQKVTLDPFGCLASVIADRVSPRPPFSADFTLWLSMIAALGLASRPASLRRAA